GNVQPVAQVPFKRFVDFFMTRPQGEFIIIVKAVIGIHTRQPSYSGIALYAHEVLIIIYLECRLECVLYLPYKDHTDLDGVTHLVVHFYLLTVDITCAYRYRPFTVKWIDPERPVFLYCSLVVTKQYQNPRRVWVDKEKPRKHAAYNENEGEEYSRTCHRSKQGSNDQYHRQCHQHQIPRYR